MASIELSEQELAALASILAKLQACSATPMPAPVATAKLPKRKLSKREFEALADRLAMAALQKHTPSIFYFITPKKTLRK